MITAYPLQWPSGWPRTPQWDMRYGKFGTKKTQPGRSYASTIDITIAEATKRVLAELSRMGVDRDDIVISTNLKLRLDGLPRSDQRAPGDAGAAVYWVASGQARRVMAIDQYYKVEENLAAIAATLDAMRAIERHGGAQILDRAFTGFTALPAPAGARDWQVVLDLGELLQPTLDDVKKAFRRLSMQHHPDRPNGSHDKMAELNAALAAAEKELTP